MTGCIDFFRHGCVLLVSPGAEEVGFVASRVLMVGPDVNAMGGVATVERNILDAVASTGCSVGFVATMADCSKLGKVFLFIKALAEVRMRIREADVCHVHTALGMSYRRKYLVCRQAAKAGVPYVLHVHEGDFENLYEAMPARERAKVDWMMDNAAKVIALSDEWDAYFRSKFGLENIAVLENAVFVPKVVGERKDPAKFYFLGRMCPKKGVDILLRAVQRLISIHPEAKVLLAGGGEELLNYKNLAAELGVADNVEFLGWADDGMKARLVDECLISVLPSNAEGLPMCVLESMAAGCASIATSVGGLPSLIDDGVNGLLVEPRDPEGLADTMAKCIENPEWTRRIAVKGRQTISDRYSMEVYLSRLASIYEEVARK